MANTVKGTTRKEDKAVLRRRFRTDPDGMRKAAIENAVAEMIVDDAKWILK